MATLREIEITTQKEWRRWLETNYEQECRGIWLVFRKPQTKNRLDYESAVEEALCFGWIDSLIKRLDEQRYARKFTPRKESSKWSACNKKRVERLIAEGRMEAPGMRLVEVAKKSGVWQRQSEPWKSSTSSPELLAALRQNPVALEFFESLARSYQLQYIGWVLAAKRPETKDRRIRESLKQLAAGQKLGMR